VFSWCEYGGLAGRVLTNGYHNAERAEFEGLQDMGYILWIDANAKLEGKITQ
jgi:hypothetical protein